MLSDAPWCNSVSAAAWCPGTSWLHVGGGLTWLSSPLLLNFLCRKAGCSQGERTCGAGEWTFLLVRLWLTGKSWNQDLHGLYGRLGIKKHSSSLFISPCLSLGHQSQHAFQCQLTVSNLPANCPDSLSLQVPAAWPLYHFALKGAQSGQADKFSFRMLACFYRVCEMFFQMLVRCQVSCSYP